MSTSRAGKVIIFDFDGTITDGVKLLLTIANEVLAELGKPPINEKQLEALRAMPPRQAIKQVGIPFWRIPWGVRFVRSQLHKHGDEINPHPGMVELLHTLKADAEVDKIYIMSSNSRTNIDNFLTRFDLTDCFDDVISGLGPYAKTKALRRLLRKYGHDPQTVILVGDETRDINAGNNVGVTTVAVSWGTSVVAQLEQTKPNHLVHSVAKLAKVLQ